MDFAPELTLDLLLRLESSPPSPAAPEGRRYRVRRWGDPVLVEEAGLSVSIVGTTNFQAVGLYNKVTGWGGVSNFLHIPASDFEELRMLQVEDDYQDKRDNWLAQKMNWLCKPEGTIYFTGDDLRFRWGTIALGNNYVTVDGFEDMLISTRGETSKRVRKMARLRSFRKTDWYKSLTYLFNMGLVHRCYCAYAGDKLGDTPKGIIYSPFWSPLDWDFSGTGQPDAFYLPLDWLEAV